MVRPGCAHYAQAARWAVSWRALASCRGRPLAVSRALSRSCRRPQAVVSQRYYAMYRKTPPSGQTLSCHDTIDCIVTHPSQSSLRLSRYNQVYRDTLLPNCTPLLLCHDTMLCIATSPQRPGHALKRPALSCPLSAVSWPLLWPYCRPCYAPAQPYHDPQAAPRPAS